MVAHSSLVTVTIDSLTRSWPLIRDAIDSREGENRIEGVRIPRIAKKNASPPLPSIFLCLIKNSLQYDKDIKNESIERYFQKYI